MYIIMTRNCNNAHRVLGLGTSTKDWIIVHFVFTGYLIFVNMLQNFSS